jgi:hypothetical protein
MATPPPGPRSARTLSTTRTTSAAGVLSGSRTRSGPTAMSFSERGSSPRGIWNSRSFGCLATGVSTCPAFGWKVGPEIPKSCPGPRVVIIGDQPSGLSRHLVFCWMPHRRCEDVDLEPRLLVGSRDAGMAEQVSHGVTVSQPADTGGRATLISDTSFGRIVEGRKRGSGGCRRRNGFGQLIYVSMGSWATLVASSVRVISGPPPCRPAFPQLASDRQGEVMWRDEGLLRRTSGRRRVGVASQ